MINFGVAVGVVMTMMNDTIGWGNNFILPLYLTDII